MVISSGAAHYVILKDNLMDNNISASAVREYPWKMKKSVADSSFLKTWHVATSSVATPMPSQAQALLVDFQFFDTLFIYV